MKNLILALALATLSTNAIAAFHDDPSDMSAFTTAGPALVIVAGSYSTQQGALNSSDYVFSSYDAKMIVLAAHEDAIAFKNGAAMTDTLQAALQVAAKSGIPEDKRLDAIIAFEKSN